MVAPETRGTHAGTDSRAAAQPAADLSRGRSRGEDRPEPAHLLGLAASKSAASCASNACWRARSPAARRALTRARIDLVRTRARRAASIVGDPLLLQQAFLNVLINAEHAICGHRPARHDRDFHERRGRSRRHDSGDTRPRYPRRRAAEDLRPVLHDEGCRTRHWPRARDHLRHRAGARRNDSRRERPKAARCSRSNCPRPRGTASRDSTARG